VVPWDGYLKYYNLGEKHPQLIEKRRKVRDARPQLIEKRPRWLAALHVRTAQPYCYIMLCRQARS
jgi:hypothetical protein